MSQGERYKGLGGALGMRLTRKSAILTDFEGEGNQPKSSQHNECTPQIYHKHTYTQHIGVI